MPWITNKIWCTLCEVAKTIKGFESITEDFKTYAKEFTHLYNSVDPYVERWPGKWA